MYRWLIVLIIRSTRLTPRRTASVCLTFFFSSRRRHTRWPRDWSSDVCSSDLPLSCGSIHGVCRGVAQHHHEPGMRRSEERRVGKEGRYRWSRDHVKKERGAACEQMCQADTNRRGQVEMATNVYDDQM